MSVIIRLQNLPWSANALDIRNFFRGLSIPEGGVHIVGGELGDAFIAFSTDEDARQAMMLDGGKIKEIQVKLLLSSRSEMHKVIETARQSVPILSLPPAPMPTPAPALVPAVIQTPAVVPVITPFSSALGTNSIPGFGIPGLGNPQEIPQPAVIEPPAPLISPSITNCKEEWDDENKEEEKPEKRHSKEKDRRRSRSRSRSRDRERKERKRDRRDRSRSRERRRRDRSRSRDRRDRKRDRKDRSRSRDRSPSRRSRDRRSERKSPTNSQEKVVENMPAEIPPAKPLPLFGNNMNTTPINQMQPALMNGPINTNSDPLHSRFTDPAIADAYNKLQELGKKRNPNAFQGDTTNGVGRPPAGRGDMGRGGSNTVAFRREGRSRFDNEQINCCVAIRNAPNHTSYGDVRRFFPFLIDKHGIKMINDNLGRRTGNIYVRFCDSRSKHMALQRKVNELKGAQVTVEDLDDNSYDAAVDSFLPFREDNDEEDVSLVIADTEEDIPAPFKVVKLTDLPNFVKEHDIIKAFSDYSLLSIMLTDCRISRTKIAFIQFAKPDEARQACEAKDGYIFGRRQATVASVTDEEFEKEKRKNEMKLNQSNIGQNDTEEDTGPRDPRQRRQQFESKPLIQKPPLVATPQTGGFFPGPFVPQPGFPQASFNPTAQYGGYPPVGGSIDPRTAAANWVNRQQFPNQPLLEKPKNPGVVTHVVTTEMEEEPLDCVLMKGLPREATDRTIVTFLSDTGAVPARIHLMLDSSGLPSGDCFCEFRSSQEARMAATKHGNNLEGCRVTVDLVPRTVVEEALEGPKQPDALLGNAPAQYFEGSRGGFAARGPYRGRGGYDRGGFARGGFDMGRGSYRGRGSYIERGRGIGFERGRGRGRGFGNSRGYENGREDDNDPALADFGAPGCVVSMENVPFRATIEEILQFFSEFELSHDDVIRRYNERGQPTGDARVAFRTPFDAQRAVKTRHMDNIHDRRISLNII